MEWFVSIKNGKTWNKSNNLYINVVRKPLFSLHNLFKL